MCSSITIIKQSRSGTRRQRPTTKGVRDYKISNGVREQRVLFRAQKDWHHLIPKGCARYHILWTYRERYPSDEMVLDRGSITIRAGQMIAGGKYSFPFPAQVGKTDQQSSSRMRNVASPTKHTLLMMGSGGQNGRLTSFHHTN